MDTFFIDWNREAPEAFRALVAEFPGAKPLSLEQSSTLLSAAREEDTAALLVLIASPADCVQATAIAKGRSSRSAVRVLAVITDAEAMNDLEALALFDDFVRLDLPCNPARVAIFKKQLQNARVQRGFELFLDGASDGYWLWYPDSDKIVWSSRTFQILEMPEVPWMTFGEYAALIHPEDMPAMAAAVQEHLAHKVPYRNVQIRVRTSKGVYRDCVASGAALRDRSGRPVLMVGSLTDISARKQVEARLEAAEQRYTALFEHMNDAAVLADPVSGLILDVNEQATRLWGRSREELVGKPQTILHPKEIMEQSREVFREHIRRLQEFKRASIELPILHSNGDHIPVEISSSLFTLGDNLRILGLFRDATERKNQEALLRERDAQIQLASRLASLGTLAAGVGHEINNPLGYLLGNLNLVSEELANNSAVSEHVRACLEDARVGAQKVREIVRDLREMSRQNDDDESVDVREVVRVGIRMATHDLRHRCTIEVDTRDIVSPAAISQARLSQIVLNLLTNAGQAFSVRPPAENVIHVSVRQDSDQVLLEVKDNGCGIPASVLERVFDPFFTTKPVGQGTGLGLSLCKKFVDGARGTIRIESAVGAGTTVHVRLPAAPRNSLPVPKMPSGKPKVLVIDDDPLSARIVERTCSKEFDVTITGNGLAAREYAESGARIDAIVCDLMMPGLTGPQLYEALAEVRPDLTSRFVFVTGGAITPGCEEFAAKAEGERRLLMKPLDFDLLRTALRRIVDGLPPNVDAGGE